MAQDHAAMLKRLLGEIAYPNGQAATERFPSLRSVDAKVREAKMILASVPGISPGFVGDMEKDPDFEANSRRIRLEALANYCRTALRFMDSGVLQPKKVLHKAPDLSKLTGSIPGLQACLEQRWLEAQRCVHAKAYLAAVVMMGSVLEGLLLARAQMEVGKAYQAKAAPRRKDGSNVAINDWNLSQLLDVAVELGWIKTDRGAFGHALRSSRNVVHPWVEVSTRASFDDGTARTSWSVLNSAVDDLLASV